MSDRPIRRRSRQRAVVLEELQSVACHPTARELYDRVRRRLPRISLGTVYRNLEQLCRCGEACRLVSDGGEARFDANTDAHDHIRCVRCGCLADLPGPPTELQPGELDETASFEIIGYRLEYLGICPACREPDTTKCPPSQGVA